MLGARRTLDELGRQHIDILNENGLATLRRRSGPYCHQVPLKPQPDDA